jgi:MFS family permease
LTHGAALAPAGQSRQFAGVPPFQRVNVLVLALCQAAASTSITVMATVSALAGYALATDKALATLPIGLQQLAVMATTVPASLLMRRIGRRAGFTVGALAGIAGGLLQAHAVFDSQFALFCLGNALVGVSNGFGLFYRFAAIDAADAAFRGKAISLVMAGGVLAAVCGPALARWSHSWFQPVAFAGAFLAIALLQGLGGLLVQLVRIPRPGAQERRDAGRPLAVILRQPAALVAIASGMVGYGVMSLVMTATPLAMIDCGYRFGDAAFVIQWHVLAMFAPSFFTGHLIARFGVLRVMLAGSALLAGCGALNLSGTGIWQFWAGLVLLGAGWNFLFIGASVLLTQCHRPEERAKVQGANDFLVFGMVTLATLASGTLHHLYGWQAVNAGALPPVLMLAALVGWFSWRSRPTSA